MRHHVISERTAAQLQNDHRCCSISTMLKIGSIKLHNVRMTQLSRENDLKNNHITTIFELP